MHPYGANIWWSYGCELINNGFTYAKTHNLYRRGIRCVDNICNTENRTFLSWHDTQIKFKLTSADNEDWITLTSKIIDKWRRLLEEDPEVTHPGHWVGLYCDGADGPAFVLQCAVNFIPFRRQQYHLSVPLTVKYFAIGTHSRCLSKWWRPTKDFTRFFHHVKITHAAKGPKKDDKKEEIFFFYSKESILKWNLDWSRWAEGYHFLNYTTKFHIDSIINMILGMTRAGDKWQG